MLWIISQALTLITIQYFYSLLLLNRIARTDPKISKYKGRLAVSTRRYPTPMREAPGLCFLMVKRGLFRAQCGVDTNREEKKKVQALGKRCCLKKSKGGLEKGRVDGGFIDSKNKCSLDWPCLPTLVQCTLFPLLLCHPSILLFFFPTSPMYLLPPSIKAISMSLLTSLKP